MPLTEERPILLLDARLLDPSTGRDGRGGLFVVGGTIRELGPGVTRGSVGAVRIRLVARPHRRGGDLTRSQAGRHTALDTRRRSTCSRTVRRVPADMATMIAHRGQLANRELRHHTDSVSHHMASTGSVVRDWAA